MFYERVKIYVSPAEIKQCEKIEQFKGMLKEHVLNNVI